MALQCPGCGVGPLTESPTELICISCGRDYPVLQSRAVLVTPDHPLFPRAAYLAETAPRRPRLATLPASVNLSLKRCMGRLASGLGTNATVLVVGAGTQRQKLSELLRGVPEVSIVATDVDPTADVDVYCDAHDLPFREGSFDAAICTAVLEHVADPVRAMGEIHRVLAPGGWLYSEIPFIQQVHEGPYDFTRYTLSGHRRLAAGFQEVESGATAGPATGFAWSFEHLLISATNGRLRRALKTTARLLMLPLVQLDRVLANRPAGLDAASCTFFLGRKSHDRVNDAEVVRRYSGSQH